MKWRLPAEWEAQEAVWFVWPRDETTWPDGRITGAREAYKMAIEAVAATQQVHVLVHPNLDMPEFDGRISVHRVEHVDSWIRDYGPLTLVGDGRRFLNFRFDAWGQKYDSLMADDHVVGRLEESGLLPATQPIAFVLEGGAVETDGEGTFLATKSVAAARGQTCDEHEAALREHLGAQKVLWLAEGIEGDDTDGHIDTIARFVGPATVVAATAPEGHPDHEALNANLQVLQSSFDCLGRPLTVHTLPAPPRQIANGEPLPAGYANFLIANDVVLVPTFGALSDVHAIETLAGLFAGRRVVGIDHRDLIWGFGGIHCLSMQVPAAP